MEKLPPIPSPPGTAFREFRITLLPFITFSVMLGLTIFTWLRYVGPGSLVGEVQTTHAIVSSTVPARISQFKVRLLDRVTAGQPIAELSAADPRLIEAQVALSRARLEYVRISIVPKLRKENNLIGYVRLRLSWLEERATLASQRAQLVFWDAEVERLRQLTHITNGTPFLSVSDLQRAESQANALRGSIAELSTLVSETSTSIEHFDPEEKTLNEENSAAIRAAIAVEQRSLDAIELQLNPVTLLSPIDGFVSVLSHNAGESVLAGAPIATISTAKSERILAFVRQPLRFELRPGMPIEVRARSFERGVGQGKVISVGGQLEPILPELLPPHIGGSATAVEYGQAVLVSIPTGLKLLPGEIVDLRPQGD